MTKKEIVRVVSEKTGLSQPQAKELVQVTFDAIIESLIQNGRIELRNFGVFGVKQRAARYARNPRTGEEVWVEAHETITFKPGKTINARVRAERQAIAAQKAKSEKAAAKKAKTTKTTKSTKTTTAKGAAKSTCKQPAKKRVK